MKIQRKIRNKIKYLPLKKMYYGIYCYKLIVYQPLRPSEDSKYLPKTKKISPWYTKKTELYISFQELKRKLFLLMMGESGKTPPLIMGYKFWGNIRSSVYKEKATLFFTDKELFDKFFQALSAWVLVVEQPINDSHLLVYNDDLNFNIEIKSVLFKNKFRYKTLITNVRDVINNKELFNTINEIFIGRDPETFYCALNYYSVTVLTNDVNDLLMLQLVVNKKLKIEKIITPSELTE